MSLKFKVRSSEFRVRSPKRSPKFKGRKTVIRDTGLGVRNAVTRGREFRVQSPEFGVRG